MVDPECPDPMNQHCAPSEAGSNGDPLRLTGEADLGVGERIRERRRALGMSQTQLAALVNVLPRQLRRYERGVERVSPAHLSTLATVLRVPISYFFREGAAN